MKKNITWGIFFILSAVAILLNAFGINFGLPKDLPIWKILLSLGLVTLIIDQLIRKKISNIFFPLIFIVMLFEKEIATAAGIESGDITNTWMFLLIALLLTVGTALITKNFTFTFNKGNEKYVFEGEDAKKILKDVASGNSVYYIDCSLPVDREIELNMGRGEIYFVNSHLYKGNGKINIDNNMGHTTIYVPNGWVINLNVENNLGHIQSPKPLVCKENAKSITISGENNLGKLSIVYTDDIEEEPETEENDD